MRSGLLVAGAVSVVVALSACSGKDHAPPLDEGDTGGTRSTGKGGTSATDGGKTGTGGPEVTIVAPEAYASPADGALVDDVIHVVCSAGDSANGAALDRTSVTITMLDADGMPLKESPATPTQKTGEFAADFVVAMVPSGAVSFKCSAKDEDKKSNSDTIATFIDHGPEITVITPMPDAAVPVKGGLDIEFAVAEVPLADGDPGAAIAEVGFSFDGVDYEPKLNADGKFELHLSIDDPMEFPQIPGGSVVITASNSRAPTAAKAVKSYSITPDGDGPEITIVKPAAKSVLGGKITIEMTVKDAATGVDPATVSIKLPGDTDPRFFDPKQGWTHPLDNDQYTYTFDSKTLAAAYQAVINVRASDKAGNPSAEGQSLQIYLDNQPPQVDLDPINMRVVNAKVCSGSFDPLGSKVPNDLGGSFGTTSIPRVARFRAFVWEQTNHVTGQSFLYYSGTNQGSVTLYWQADPDKAEIKLLVGKNPQADNTCDDIGGIDTNDKAPIFSQLKKLDAAGVPWNFNDPGEAPTVDPACLVANSAPEMLCPSHASDLWYVPTRGVSSGTQQLVEPLIYAYAPGAGGTDCTGTEVPFDNAPEGWICLAARATDNSGNVGISPPMRICMDDPDTAEHPDCAVMSTTPPTCTDGCTPPDRGGGQILVVN